MFKNNRFKNTRTNIGEPIIIPMYDELAPNSERYIGNIFSTLKLIKDRRLVINNIIKGFKPSLFIK